jgi:hypothetical protein
MARKKVEHGDMLDATHCTRCGEDLDKRSYSFFVKNEVIGLKCYQEESDIKKRLSNKGENPESYYHCGSMPLV